MFLYYINSTLLRNKPLVTNRRALKMFSVSIVKFLLFFVLIFNVIDAAVSTSIIYYGNFEEANPVMETFLGFGIMPFILAKSILVGGGCTILWRYRDKLVAQWGAYIAFVFYLALMYYFYFFYMANI